MSHISPKLHGSFDGSDCWYSSGCLNLKTGLSVVLVVLILEGCGLGLGVVVLLVVGGVLTVVNLKSKIISSLYDYACHGKVKIIL